MARRGPQPKHPDQKLRRNVQRLEVIEGERLEIPKAPREWLKVTTEAWQDFWDSPVADLVRAKDLPALVRLFNMRNEYERLRRMAHKHPLVEGSQGQLVKNPAHAMMRDYMVEIRQLEREFGLTPDAGARMATATATAATSVSEMMKAASDDFQIIDVAGD